MYTQNRNRLTDRKQTYGNQRGEGGGGDDVDDDIFFWFWYQGDGGIVE